MGFSEPEERRVVNEQNSPDQSQLITASVCCAIFIVLQTSGVGHRDPSRINRFCISQHSSETNPYQACRLSVLVEY